ncbi:Sulfite reductase [NADPH] flavoprotein alpha-component [Thalassovita gelatinovora]|uniref:NADPH--hemoprotein reductase n=1 Tax=Thalassovita gelatinovora TaxID=53501 RepID=A0A0P1G2F3_THAGE|nr:PepSY domain-containing protein [Thalassovita gelatinovora]QIZ82001.1 N-acetylglucosamine transferase [Thalassovita gelatinovora]CUH67453.1 Sulfite reductase [NADPH] flavoprotein alpha-component [Thalassovita gelatinovora]SEP73678.1 sulfite reductase (NADPH) flavoprotein alpha-component [Thalassovita gelatinovora]
MIRVLHRWPGLLALVLVTVLALSGAALSIFPAAERLSAPQAEAGLRVAELATRIQVAYPGVEQIRRAPSGRITAYWFDQGTPGAAVIDPATGQGVASADPNQTVRWLTNLHRSLFLGDGGRIAMALGAAAMLVLSVSGVALVARRVGGWRHWFAPLRGPLAGRLHVEIARIAVLGLMLSSTTALWMTASTFDLLPDGGAVPTFPNEVSGEMGATISDLATLATTPVADLRELSFPYPDDPTDVFTLKTDHGTGYLDQGNGALLVWADLTGWDRVSETIYMLHTGQGAAMLGLVLGLMALGLPAMGATGVLIWLTGRRGRPRIRGNQSAARAETILLVGSEGGSTWGFAATLHAALTDAGQSVHTAPMSTFAPDRYARADRIIVLASTYGDGASPASANGFLDRLAALDHAPKAPLAVLGFGDRNFPAYCAFAKAVSAAAEAKGWSELIPFDTVDRQSPQDFVRWGRALGQAMGLDLELVHQPAVPATETLTLISRRDYGAEVQVPTAILRFALPRATLWKRLSGAGFARFNAGDLIGILPEGSPVPRLYSLASARRDGFVEIVVRKHPGGLGSSQLTALEPGERVAAFLRRNPGFQPGRGSAPLILIGAGTGIGPLAGFVRGNARRRPIHLFFGMRHPDSDFFYGEEMRAWQQEGRLSRLVTAVSRGGRPRYVQDAVRDDAAEVARLVRNGARVLVCGGRDMAAGVSDALVEILAPVGLTPAVLKAEGRYVEDVY